MPISWWSDIVRTVGAISAGRYRVPTYNGIVLRHQLRDRSRGSSNESIESAKDGKWHKVNSEVGVVRVQEDAWSEKGANKEVGGVALKQEACRSIA